MNWNRIRLLGLLFGAIALVASACGSSSSNSNWATATSAAGGGGMSALVAAAKAEGKLNVIALPPDWANYGSILKAFTNKYGITINSANPDGSSQDEINAVKQLGTQDRAPDVLAHAVERRDVEPRDGREVDRAAQPGGGDAVVEDALDGALEGGPQRRLPRSRGRPIPAPRHRHRVAGGQGFQQFQ